jgi:hypothetical protein
MKKIIVLLSILSGLNLIGKENPASDKAVKSLGGRVMSGCTQPRSSRELWINNVRTIIYTGGDMWWDLFGNSQAYYIVPATQNRATGVSSLFAGSIWLGGLDAGGQLKVAAMTYRQNGIDFWPGPLDTVTAAIDAAECTKWDGLFSISRSEVDVFYKTGVISTDMRNWPGNGNVSKNQALRLAPFIDVNNDGFYNPTDGDYPAYDVNDKAEKDNLGFCKAKIFGDFTLFWVFNDKGNVHSETQGVPIGVEVRAQAFAFKTNDEINNMTFYSYEIFNRSSFQLNKTYFTIWNDADLGYYLDDYVGCDVSRGLGYMYNASTFDPTIAGANGYGDFPPAVGCDFFKGPLADNNDGIDNNFNGVVDEPGETIQMSRFTYYNNNYGAFPAQTTNPDDGSPIHYYNYMTGFWKDGSPFTFGGNAYGGTSPVTFVYPGNPITGVGWTERGAGNLPGDRRFLQSAGPFTLKPGAVNEITFGIPWAQSPVKGGNLQSVQLMFLADDKAQALFDNCFKILDGPEAPIMTVQETSNELFIYLTNEKGKSNNYRQFNNDYSEVDISILSDPTSSNPKLNNPDKTYRFEGYIVYQVRDANVSATDLTDPTKAIPVFQCDLQNGVGRIKNYEVDNSAGGYVPKIKVEGADKGITTTFRVTEDAFSTAENRQLINNKTYYFVSVAYAYNNYLTYQQDVPASVDPNNNLLGQKKPYLEGRKIKRAAGIPHVIDSEKNGTLLQADYGFGPKITRVEGQGNGGNFLTLTKASEDEIVEKYFKADVTYENAMGPLSIRVVDPLNVKNSTFSFRFINQRANAQNPIITQNAMIPTATANRFTGIAGALNVETSSWVIENLGATNQETRFYYPNDVSGNAGDTTYQTIKVGSEFYFPDLGFSINVKQASDPGQDSINLFTNFNLKDKNYNGPLAGSFIGASLTYVNGTANWLNPVVDVDGSTPLNWILSGTSKTEGAQDAYYNVASAADGGGIKAFYDPQKQYGKILGGTWAPYSLVASFYTLALSGNAVYPYSRVFGGPGFVNEVWDNDPYFEDNGFRRQNGVGPQPGLGNTDMRRLGSTLVVFTKDKTKWTRCVVLEMQEKAQLSEGNAFFFGPRKHQSIDKNGRYSAKGSGASSNPDDANFISETGMGWFPGYAINLETGERLNMAFGEDSYQKENNGNDMIWNPTSNNNFPFSYSMGGKHFLYVFSGNCITSKFYPTGLSKWWETALVGKPFGVGRYDAGKRIMDILTGFFNNQTFQDNLSGTDYAPLDAVLRDIMWVSMPMPRPGFGFTDPANMPSDVRVQINISKPYRYGYSGVATIPISTLTGVGQSYASTNRLTSANSPSLLTTDTSANRQNNNFPMYTFNTNDIATLFDQSSVSKGVLDQIRVVPNPYYGSSSYELISRTDSRVRITNLPSKCTVRIYSLNGALVRTFIRDVSGQEDLYVLNTGGNDIRQSQRLPYLDWDLKNQNNIFVSSGLYIIHIDAPGVGEKVIKWFGVMRPLDVQSY